VITAHSADTNTAISHCIIISDEWLGEKRLTKISE